MDLIRDELPPIVVARPIYRGPGPLPKCRREGTQHPTDSLYEDHGAALKHKCGKSVGKCCMENKKNSMHTQDLSMEMHRNKGKSVSTYPHRP